VYRQWLADFALDHGACFMIILFDQGEIIDTEGVLSPRSFGQYKAVSMCEGGKFRKVIS
jgi:hypothetical protein